MIGGIKSYLNVAQMRGYRFDSLNALRALLDSTLIGPSRSFIGIPAYSGASTGQGAVAGIYV